MQEVRLAARSPEDLIGAVPPERLRRLLDEVAPQMRDSLAGHSVVNINSTAAGGGVAEMLQVLLPFSRGAGVDARWLVVDADPEFFAITKRLHHRLHGRPGDGGAARAGPSATTTRPCSATTPSSWRRRSPRATW